MDQRPHADADVSPSGFYELTHSDLPHFLLNLVNAPKLDQSVTPSLSRREPLPDFRLRRQVHVCLDLFSELLFHTVLVEQVAPEAGQAGNQRHDCFSSGRSTSLPAIL